MKNFIYSISILSSFLLCSGCIPPVPPEAQQYVHKTGAFKQRRMLCEFDAMLNLTGVLVASDTDKSNTGCLYGQATFEKYASNPHYWQQWHGFQPRSRVVGIIQPGTHYTIDGISSAGEGGGVVYEITLSSGFAAGKKISIRSKNTPDF